MSNRMFFASVVALMLPLVAPAMGDRAIAQTSASTGNTVVMTVNGQTLTQQMLDDFIALGEFIAAREFTETDRQALRVLLTSDFRANPTLVIDGHNSVRGALDLTTQFKDPTDLVKARELLAAKTYFDVANQDPTKTNGAALLLSLAIRYSPVLVSDPETKLVIPERSIDFLIARRNFTAEITGVPSIAITSKDEFRQWLQQNFRSLPRDSQEYYAFGESDWLKLQAAWSNLSPQQKQEVVADIQQYVRTQQAAQEAPSGGNTLDRAAEAGVQGNEINGLGNAILNGLNFGW
jgi:hypothetical protein